jgi:Ca-activated chloride channel family protein
MWEEQESSEFARREDALSERWKDAGPWLVLLLLPLALLGFRRGLFFVLPLLMLPGMFHSAPARADWWENIWQRKDQQAYQALQSGQAEKAAALARNPGLSGEAWYRSDEFRNALDSWAQLDSADAHYNRGNALAHLGEYEAAIEAYDRALALETGMQDASFNRELLEQMKEQQEQQQDGEDGESQEGDSSKEQQEGDQSQQSEGEKGDEGEQSEQQEGDQDGEQQEGEMNQQEGQQQDYAEAWTEEDAQAMEQWLRRIPDDPGGLLRRKFRNQHQRRGAPEDETEAW